MSLETPKLQMKKVRVSIAMKSIVFVDKYVTVPTKAEILDFLAERILGGIIDEKFLKTITPEE